MTASTAANAEAASAAEAWVPGCSALDQERNEVYESVGEAARLPDRDIELDEACTFLLRHLASTARKRALSYIM